MLLGIASSVCCATFGVHTPTSSGVALLQPADITNRRKGAALFVVQGYCVHKAHVVLALMMGWGEDA